MVKSAYRSADRGSASPSHAAATGRDCGTEDRKDDERGGQTSAVRKPDEKTDDVADSSFFVSICLHQLAAAVVNVDSLEEALMSDDAASRAQV